MDNSFYDSLANFLDFSFHADTQHKYMVVWKYEICSDNLSANWIVIDWKVPNGDWWISNTVCLVVKLASLMGPRSMWTPTSAVPKKAVELNHSLPHPLLFMGISVTCAISLWRNHVKCKCTSPWKKYMQFNSSPLDKRAAILQVIFLDAFPWKVLYFDLNFTGHNLNQWWFCSLMHMSYVRSLVETIWHVAYSAQSWINQWLLINGKNSCYHKLKWRNYSEWKFIWNLN